MSDPRTEVEPMMADLSDDEREVLSARLGLDRGGAPRTFEEVASMLGREVDELRAVESSALSRLRVAE